MVFPHAVGVLLSLPLLVPGERLSLPELCAARLDGDVVELGDLYAPADRVETAHLRAASIAGRLQGRPGLAFAGPSAAWIHGAGDRPPPWHEAQLTGRRVRLAASQKLLLHETPLKADHLFLGEVPVATPARTLLDLVRWSVRRPVVYPWAVALGIVRPDLVDTVRSLLRPPGSGATTSQAAELLASLEREVAAGLRTT